MIYDLPKANGRDFCAELEERKKAKKKIVCTCATGDYRDCPSCGFKKISGIVS